ncbi:hypothetical protein SSX86_024498 [Deinandra increscens subsp. villosa]|uniref:Protein kinase domain-containing protein n=1 Tax=Deinandra increscens subsp. villosa TaxID=3103831 RepID=A0AAP0CI47_9ASTR
MEKYEIMEKLGGGTFGVVWKALNKQTRETVAIKKLLTKYESSSDKLMIKREVKSLLFNKDHENIVTLKDIINENNTIFLVFEHMESSLYDRMKIMKAPFSESQIREICFQIFKGLAYMHQNGYIHRDLKPMNLLVSENVIKIGDFGSARETKDELPYTHNVTTSSYRAPEVFLYSKVYDSAVDMWAMGAIMAELFTSQLLFQGSSDLHVMHKICSVLGTPTESSWFQGLEQARNINYRFPDLPGVRFSELLPTASPEAVDLIGSLLSWLPSERMTAMQALLHPFFDSCYCVPQSIRVAPSDPATDVTEFKLALLQELLEKKSSSKSCEDIGDDGTCMLPENPFEFMN